jgi:MATE family multidrug resistance protein
MGSCAVAFWLFPETLIGLFLDFDNPDAAEVLAIGVGFVAIAALFQVFDGTQVIGGSLLRGLSDTKVPMFIAVVGYWGIGMGAAYGLGFPLGYGGLGIWWGLAAGLAVVAVVVMWRFALRERIGLV